MAVELTCAQLVELVTDYLESVTDPELDAAVRRHLERCHGCRHYLEQVQQTVESLRLLGG